MSKKIKVLALSDTVGQKNFNPVRPEAAQLVGLHETGKVEVTVVCSPGSVLEAYFRDNGINVIAHKRGAKISLRSIFFIRNLIRKSRFDILHLWHSRAISNGVLAAIGLPVKVIVYRGNPGSIKRYDPLCYLNCLNPRIDKIICVSKAVEKAIRKQIWGDTKKPVTIYKGHDLNWYGNPPADLSGLDLPEGAFVAVMVANLRPHKGLHVLIEATHFLPNDAPIYILLVGPRSDDPYAVELVSKAAQPDKVRLLGYRDDAPEVAAASDLLVLPSTKREGLARAAIEAMAYGTPVIASDVGGNPELVEDNVTGLIVREGDAEQLAKGIQKLYSDSDFRGRCGAASRERIKTHFDLQQGIEKTLNVYLDIVDCQ